MASQLLVSPLPYADQDRLVVPWPGRAVPGRLLGGIIESSASFDRLAFYWDRGSAEYYDPSQPDARASGYTVAFVSRGYLDLLGLEPVLGRTFRDRDVPPPELRGGANKVVLTHRAWVELFGADTGVLGRPVRNGRYTTEIIGVMPPAATPMARGQDGWAVVGFERQLAAIPRAHFEVVARLESADAMERARADLETRLARLDSAGAGDVVLPQWAVPASFGRSALALLGALAFVALGLGLLGIYGVTALNTVRRTRELGIRMALGARGVSVARLVVNQGAGVVAGGLVVGLAVAAGLSPFMAGMLFRVDPLDPVTFGGVAAILLATGVLASLVPAIRASRLDPAATLREE